MPKENRKPGMIWPPKKTFQRLLPDREEINNDDYIDIIQYGNGRAKQEQTDKSR